MNLLSPQLKKLLTSSVAILSVLGYGVFVFAAQLPDGTPPPVGGYALGGDTILDPGCAPGTADCIVRPGWVFDTTNDYLYTTTEKVGIGTDTPTHDLTVEGDVQMGVNIGTALMGYGLGDLANFGGNLGHGLFVADSVGHGLGLISLDWNNGSPTLNMIVSDDPSSVNSSLNLWSAANPSPVNQLFALQAGVPLKPDHYAGYEAQNDPDGLKAKIYYATPLTNLSVIEVGENGIGLYSQDHTQNVFLGNQPGGFNGFTTTIPTTSLNTDAVTTTLFQGDLNSAGVGGDQGFIVSVGNADYSKVAYTTLDYENGSPSANLGGIDIDSGGNLHASSNSVGMGFTTLSTQNDGNGTPLVIQVGDENTRGGGFSARTRNLTYANAGADMFVRDQALGGDRTWIWMDETKIDSGLMLDPTIPGARNYTINNISEMSFEFHSNDPTTANNSKYLINADFVWSKPALGSTLMTLSGSTGNLGIATVASNDKLEVFGDIRVGTTGVNGCLKDFSGGTITGTCSSDERLKTNIQPVTGILEKLSQVNLVTYEWNDTARSRGFTPGVQQLGVLAQNVESVFPEFVVTDKDGYKQVNYARLNLLNLEAIRELNTKVQNFETILNVASRSFIGEEAQVKRLCLVGDDGSKTCVTKNQLDHLLQGTTNTTSIVNQPDTTSSQTTTPETTIPETTNSETPEVVVNSDTEVVTPDVTQPSGEVTASPEAPLQETPQE